MQEVTLAQMLEARESRAMEQQRLLEKYGKPVICFTMNIPGPVKDTPLIRRGFQYGWEALNCRIPKNRILYATSRQSVTGCEGMYAVDMDPLSLKALTTAIEDDTELGRLFDMDVLDARGDKLDRELVGGKSRNCIVCGAAGRGCASRRSHSVPQLQQAVRKILRDHFAREDAKRIGTLAAQSLLDEVCTTPKPGLVDRRNSGSHRDMDIFTFSASAAALSPYFLSCTETGIQTADRSPEETFRLLRTAGLRAEQDMYRATKGVNTHKGAIFTMGILCGAAGRLWDPASHWDPAALLKEVSAMTRNAMEEDLRRGSEDTAGQRLYARQGVTGIRGEIARGLPSVETIGLPAYRDCLSKGLDRNTAGAVTLLHLIAKVEDTNMLSRGGAQGAAEGAAWARSLIAGGQIPTTAQMEALDDRFIRQNLSPGGCADLLTAVYFVEALKNL